ncbi:protein kinase domain-containing protein [Colletotrichum acutatum]
MLASRVNDIHECDRTGTEVLSSITPPAPARQRRQSTSEMSAMYFNHERGIADYAACNPCSTSSAIRNAQSPLGSSTAHDVSCCEPSRIATGVPVAWQGGFTGGAAIGSFDYDKAQASIPFQSGPGCSEPGETDAVVSVRDLGFSAAPCLTHQSNGHRPSQSDIFKHTVCTGQFLKHGQSAVDIEDEIRYKIENNLRLSEMDQEEYLPVDSFENIFNIETMMCLIKAIYDTATDECFIQKADQIWGGAAGSRRRIVATLVLMKQTSRVEEFIQEGIFDHHLPLCREIKSRKEFKTFVGDGRINMTLFENWERVHIDLFYFYQKAIFVPFLSMGSKDICSYVFNRNIRLPWDKFEQKVSGGNGTIHRLQIHQSHHDYRGNNVSESPPCFAVKEINGANHESYRKELRALEQSCAKAQKAKHLIKLLLTFQHGNKLYLVFEWADGNLEEFWKKKQVHASPSSTKWIAQQCRGIANAIKRIHGLSTWQKDERSSSSNSEEPFVKDWGRHGDIKPTNILWFSTHGEDRDHLVVADLGLTRYHSRLTKSRVMRVDGYTGTYRAPEIDLGLPISSKYDIWSLGCVFLEFCIWYLLGYEDVENFQRDRNLNRGSDDTDDIDEPDHSYFVISCMPQGGKRAELHPAVQKVSRSILTLLRPMSSTDLTFLTSVGWDSESIGIVYRLH